MSAWHSVLSEVRQQIARASQDSSGAHDSWLDLAEDVTTTASQRQATLLWQQQQWHNAFEVLVCLPLQQQGCMTNARSLIVFTLLLQFFQAPISSAHEQDDLLFFVYLEAYQVLCLNMHAIVLSAVTDYARKHRITDLGLPHVDMMQAETPYFVRRKSKVLPTELQTAGEKAHQVDWKRSVLLNLVTQTTYSLTVSACTREHLQSVGSSHASPGSVQVMKRPSHNLDLLTAFVTSIHQSADLANLAITGSLACSVSKFNLLLLA